MPAKKGGDLEEIVRAYMARQGFFSLRSVSVKFEEEEVTDIDVWAYGRQAVSIRTRTIVDVKDKRSPKAFERILWARGMQLALACDRALVATTDNNPKVVRFAQQQKVALLSRQFLDRLQSKIDLTGRLSLDQFQGEIRKNPNQKQDGDWVRLLSEAKSAVVSLPGYPAFNKICAIFRFFAVRVETKPQHREQALRCAYFSAALACIALDAALEQSLYEDNTARYRTIAAGVTYGDTGDGKVQKSIDTLLSVISEGMQHGRVVAREAKDAIDKLFQNVRADVIAEYYSKEHNANTLFLVGTELEDAAHRIDTIRMEALSVEAKSALGILADFVQVKRSLLIGSASGPGMPSKPAKADIPPMASSSEQDGGPDVGLTDNARLFPA